MKRSCTLAVAAILLSAAAAPAFAAPQAFDLDCSGVETRFGSSERTPETRRYTVDLAAKRWCRTSECREALPIERVTADEITFVRSAPGETVEHRHYISRVSGQFAETVVAAGSGSRTSGSCTVAKFSGFPKAKF